MNIELKRNTVTGMPIHSHRGPSGAHRWMNCDGSVNLMAKLGLQEEESSEDAARGTVCHTVSSQCLMSGKEPWEYSGQRFKEGEWEFEIDEELVPLIDEAVTLVRGLMKKYEHLGAIMYVETQVRSEFDPEAYGTADIRIEVPGHFIIIIDFKFGVVRVEANDEQLRQYGYYSYEERGKRMTGKGEPTEIQMCIIQPRLPNPADHIRWHKETPQQLEEWFFGEVIPAFGRSRDPDALLTMGDHCRFCPVLRDAKCPAWIGVVEELPLNVAPSALSNEQIGKLRKQRKMIEKFMLGVDGEALTRMRMGQIIPGAKLVNKIPHRVWHATTQIQNEDGTTTTRRVEDILVTQYGADAKTPPKLKSPAQIEELSGGASFSTRYAYKPDTGVTVADEEDSRPAVIGLMERADRAKAETEGVPV